MKRYIGPGIISLFTTCLAFAQVSVTTPQNHGTVGAPAQFVASAHGEHHARITAMRIYVDNRSVYLTSHSSLNTPVNMSVGNHYVVVQAWDAQGHVYKTPLTLTVSGNNLPPGIPPNAQVFANIQQMSGWQNCDSCAGPNGQGPHIPHGMAQGQATPAIDANSTQYWIGGHIPYTAALWWKQLGPKPDASNFVYDLYFYVQDANAAQALEFDANQSVNRKKFIFGTECNYNGSHQWDVWNNATRHWDASGIACTRQSAYTWHHLIWQFHRTADGRAVFVALTLDGQTSYVNRSSAASGSGVQELNVAFQMDGDYRQDNYSAWLDEVSLYYW